MLAQAARYSFYGYNENDDLVNHLRECSRICENFIASANVRPVCICTLLLGLAIASDEDPKCNAVLKPFRKDWPSINILDKRSESKGRAVGKHIMRACMRFCEPLVVSSDEILAEMGE